MSEKNEQGSRVDSSPAGQGTVATTATANGGPATPLPWSVSDSYDHIVRGPDGLAIFECWCRGYRHAGAGSDAAANARYIVTAANAFPELLAALKELVADCEEDFETEAEDDESVGGGEDGPMRLTFGAIRRARAAITKAEGR